MASPPDSSPHRSPSEEGNMEKNIQIRFLVSHAEAGVVIGKGGSTINDFQTQSGARIHLSRNRELFPGTTDSIVTVSGVVNNTLEAVNLILSKLLEEFCGKDGDYEEPTSSLKIIVPNSSCGGLIGKGGANIRSFKDESRADIVVSPQDNSYHGPDYRLVIIYGTIEEKMVAIDLILSKLADDPHYVQSLNAPFPYAGQGKQLQVYVKCFKEALQSGRLPLVVLQLYLYSARELAIEKEPHKFLVGVVLVIDY